METKCDTSPRINIGKAELAFNPKGLRLDDLSSRLQDQRLIAFCNGEITLDGLRASQIADAAIIAASKSAKKD